MKKIILISIYFSILLSIDFVDKCGLHQNPVRTHRPDRDAYIDSPSGHFRVHYDTSGQHYATISYVQQVGEAADYSRYILVDVMGYLPEIDDSDGIYDIYLYGFSNGNYGYNASDCEGYWTSSGNNACEGSEVSGASFIVIDNDFNYTCSDIPGLGNLCVDENSGVDVMKVTIAHEFFHAIQRAYVNPKWLEGLDDLYFMELNSTWMEDVVYPDINDYLNFAYPYLRTPELNISCYYDVCGEETDNGYSLALFGHYLTKIYDDVENEQDGIIMREIFEEFTGAYPGQARDAIDYILINNYSSTFSNAWADFNARNVFNSEFSDSYNRIYYYEDQKYINPILCSNNDCGSFWNAEMNISSLSSYGGSTSSDLLNQEGAVSIKSYEVDNLSFLDFIFDMDTPDQIIDEDFASYVAIESTNLARHRVYDLNYFLNYTCSDLQYENQTECEEEGDLWEPVNSDIIALDNIDKIHIFGAFNGSQSEDYTSENNLGFTLNYSTADNYNLGDINLDNNINIIDITSLIYFILEITNISDYQFNLIDMNNDSNVNIVDVMTVIYIILDS